MRSFCYKLLVGCLACVCLASTTGATSVHAASCNDLEIVFARGSGSPLGEANFQTFSTSIKQALKSHVPHVTYNIYELGSASHGGAQYPAVEVDSFKNASGAIISAGNSYAFGESVKSGRTELSSYINGIATKCPNTKFALAGYSQGAMVISTALSSINSSKILYAATFGDPKLHLPEGHGLIPAACFGRNLSNYRVDVPDCRVENGILGGLDPYEPSGLSGKLGAWCNASDFMCGSGFNFFDLFGAHTSYKTDSSYQTAADIIAKKATTTFKAASSSTTSSTSKPSSGKPSSSISQPTAPQTPAAPNTEATDAASDAQPATKYYLTVFVDRVNFDRKKVASAISPYLKLNPKINSIQIHDYASNDFGLLSPPVYTIAEEPSIANHVKGYCYRSHGNPLDVVTDDLLRDEYESICNAPPEFFLVIASDYSVTKYSLNEFRTTFERKHKSYYYSRLTTRLSTTAKFSAKEISRTPTSVKLELSYPSGTQGFFLTLNDAPLGVLTTESISSAQDTITITDLNPNIVNILTIKQIDSSGRVAESIVKTFAPSENSLEDQKPSSILDGITVPDCGYHI